MNESTNPYLIITSRDELFRFNIDNIVYFESEGNYSNIILANGHKASVCLNLSQLQEVISHTLGKRASRFARVGRRHIINLHYVQAIMTLQQRAILSDGLNFTYTIQASKDALKKLRDLFVRHLLVSPAAKSKVTF